MKRTLKVDCGYHTLEVEEYMTPAGKVWKREVADLEFRTKKDRPRPQPHSEPKVQQIKQEFSPMYYQIKKETGS